MVKVGKKASSRHELSSTPALSTFIKTTLALPLSRIPNHLSSFPRRWPFPRGDLYHWIPVLDRFDHILELFTAEYGLRDGPQTQAFESRLLLKSEAQENTSAPLSNISQADLIDLGFSHDGDKELVEGILNFSRMLLENCGNRSLYASSGRLGALLNTTSLSLLSATLSLAVRLAQRYHASRQRTVGSAQQHSTALLASHYNIDLEKVQKLASPFIKASTPPPTLPSGASEAPGASVKGKEKAIPATSNRPTTAAPVHASNLVALVKGLPATPEEIAQSSGGSAENCWDAWGAVSFAYYASSPDTAEVSKQTLKEAEADNEMISTPTTPTPGPRTFSTSSTSMRESRLATLTDPSATSASSKPQKSDEALTSEMKTLEISSSQVSTTPIYEILKDTLPNVPRESHYELLSRLRVASALCTSRSTRREILAIRLLAITNLAYIHPETQFQQKILQQDSDEPRRLQLVFQLAELLQPADGDGRVVPRELQTLALGALEALAKHKSKAADVCTALSTNVNHGILLYMVRKAVAELAENEDGTETVQEYGWREALFALLRTLPSTAPRTGEGLVSAGLLPILLEILTLRTDKAECNYAKVLEFFDSFVYTVRDAFQNLANAKGLDKISDLTVHEVNFAFNRAQNGEGLPIEHRNQMIDYQIPFFQQQTLRWLFKFMNRMMGHSGGTFDRLLRNLIDSPELLGGLRTVISNAKVFGSSVWSGAVNILNNFIHNEPTSYAVIAEAGLSKSLLEAVTGKTIDLPGEAQNDGPQVNDTPSADDSSAIMNEEAVGVTQHDDGESGLSVATRNVVTRRVSVGRRIEAISTRERPLAEGILPATDAIATIPQAFGAICLNSAGQKLFLASNALQSFFEIFESSDHVKCMNQGPDLANVLGQSFDELVRHHPPLKEEILKSVLAMVTRVGTLCNARASSHGVGAKLWLEGGDGQLHVSGGWLSLSGQAKTTLGKGKQADSSTIIQAKSVEVDDVEMSDAQTPFDFARGSSDRRATFSDVIEKEDDKLGPTVPAYINVVSKFLSGFFTNTSLCSAFIETGGSENILDFTRMPSLQYDFNNHTASQELARVVHTLVEQKPHLVLPSLIKRTQSAADQLKLLSEKGTGGALFAAFVSRDELAIDEHGLQAAENIKAYGTSLVKSLVTLHTLCTVLYETFSTPMFNHRSSQTVFHVVNLSDMYVQLVKSLGQLQRSCVLEDLSLQKYLPDSWKEATRFKGFGLGSDDSDNFFSLWHQNHDLEQWSGSPLTLPTDEHMVTSNENLKTPSDGSTRRADNSSIAAQEKTAQYKNARVLRYLLSQLPSSIMPFFQGLGKVLVAKRAPEPYQRQNALMVADAIAKAAIEQLTALQPTTSFSDGTTYGYYNFVLTSISQLMVDTTSMDRPGPQSLTLVLQAFKNNGGFNATKHILEVFRGVLRSEDSTPNVSAHTELASRGIKTLLSFYSQVTVAKHVVEASQATAIASKDREKGRHDYFSPSQFLVELRMVVLPVVRSMWDSDYVEKASSPIVKSLIEILRTILESDHEHGAYKRSDKISVRGKSSFKAWKMETKHSNKLQEIGFSENLVREALYRCNNSFSSAQEYCIAQAGYPEAFSNPVPSYEENRTSVRFDEKSMNRADSDATIPEIIDATEEAQPPTASSASDGGSLLLENLQAEVEEVGDSASPASLVPPPPPAPGVPSEEDGSDDQGNLTMSMENIFPSLQPSINEEQNQRNGLTPSGSSGSPSHGNSTEASKLTSVITTDDLNDERAGIRKNLIDRSLDVLNVHSDVTFELSELITTAVSKSSEEFGMRAEIGETLVQSLISFQMDGDLRPAGRKIAAYAHLLALVLQDKDFYEATLDELKDNFSTLLEFIKIIPDQSTEEQSPWIGQVLLIIEKLLADDSQPRQIEWTPPSSDDIRTPTPIAELSEPIIPIAEKTQLYEAIIEILPRVGKDGSLALSVVRVLVTLTRNRKLAMRLGEKRNMQRLFVMVKQLAGSTNDKLQSAFMLVLRHVVEDEETLRQIMSTEIQEMFDTRQQRQVDTTSYTRQMYHLVLRAPEIFIEATNDKLALTRFDSSQRPQALSLKKEAKADEVPSRDVEKSTGSGGPVNEPRPHEVEGKGVEVKPSTDGEGKETTEKLKATEVKAPVVENPDGVIHYLLCELLSYKDVEDKAVAAPAKVSAHEALEGPVDIEMTNGNSVSAPQAPAKTGTEGKQAEKPEFKADQHPIYIYRCFLLQCLTELLSCYNRTKIEFINFSRKADPQSMTPSKPRSGVLNYILNAVVPVGTLNQNEDMASRKKVNTSAWAISAIVALCSKTGERGHKYREHTDGPEEPDLLFVRKFVLEHALKAFKDASASNEPLDYKYSRMLNIADLFNHLLTTRPNTGGSTVNQEMFLASQKQLARVMYEKNFIAALTTSIADIDVNFPGAKRAVKYILKPLKLLTQTAFDLSISSSISTTPGQTDEDEISTASSVSDIEDGREETPDLFRNSTLGMFEPGREHDSSSESSEDDEDMYDDEYGDEMEYEEEIVGEDGDVVSDEEEGMGGMGPMEGLSGDIGMQLEVVMDEHDVPSDEEEDDDDESDGVDGEDLEIVGDLNGSGGSDGLDEGEEGSWQDEGEDEPDYDEEVAIEEGLEHDHPHNFPIHNIVRAIEEEGGPEMLERVARIGGGDLDMDLDPEGYMEEVMEGEEEDEEDDDEEDMEDDEDVMYEPDYEDDELGMPNMPWGWDADEPPIVRGHRHHHHHHHNRGSPWSMFSGGTPDRGMLMPTYRSHRPAGGPRSADDGTNPLLQRTPEVNPRGPIGTDESSEWLRAMDAGLPPRRIFGHGTLGHDDPTSLINNLMSAMSQGGPGLGALHHHGGALTFHVNGGPPGVVPRELQAILGMRRPQLAEYTRPPRDDPAQAVSFASTVTVTRWQEEARLLYGAIYLEKSQRVINSLLRVLVPPAMEAEKLHREKEAAEAAKLQEAREKRLEEERLAREKAEKEAQEKRQDEERAAAVAAAAAVEAEAASATATVQEREEMPNEGANVNVETTEEPSIEQAMEGVESEQQESRLEPPVTEQAEAGPSEPAVRVHTTIRGRELDITGMGIDPTFFEGLPDDLREEVIMNQLSEQRSQAAAAGQEPTDISREFLEALPANIRDELLQQEAETRRRREQAEARNRAAANGGPAVARAEEMDPASFLASLDPTLRQIVLMDQGDEVLAQLPEAIAEEARALGGDRRLRQYMDARIHRVARGLDQPDRRDVERTNNRPQRRPIVQMLDKAGVATLLRLMFVPQQGSIRHSLNDILRNVCGNKQNRAEVVNLLLSILQDGSADMSAVERSFAQLTLRAKQPPAHKTPQPLKRALTGPLPQNGLEMSPLMVVQQCLTTLVFLTQYNPHIPSFFLTEHEPSVGLKSRASRKGKGKENKANKYPLNALLSLLDRKLIMESSSVMEQLSSLLNSITHPLMVLTRKHKEKMKPQAAVVGDGQPSIDAQPNVPASTSTTVTTEPEESFNAEVTQPEINNCGDQQLPDAATTDVPSASQPSAEATNATTSATESKEAEGATANERDATKKQRVMTPPIVPDDNLRLVVNILAARECSSKTFRETLSTISNLSAIPGAKEVFGKELVKQAQNLGRAIVGDLERLLPQIENAHTGTDVQGMALSKFSPASSDQAKLLRALTALDYLFENKGKDTPVQSESEKDGDSSKEKHNLLTSLYENPTFGLLWNQLSECLGAIRQRENMLNVATILLPLIETLMVVCKNTTLKDPGTSRIQQKEAGITSPLPESRMENLFFKFTEEHRKILNDLVRHNPKLMSGTFTVLVKNPKVLEFDNKRNYFTRKLHDRGSSTRQAQPPLQLSVRRDQVFLDSFKSLHFKKGDEMKYGKLSIRFQGEEGVDAGGVTREWFQVLSRQMFNPDYALFTPVASDRTTFHPNRTSGVNQEHLTFFEFIGRIIGKALYEGRVLDCHFSRAVYKRILGKAVSIKDMETLDLDYYKSLVWMLENDITEIITENFSVETNDFGERQTIDLIADGRNIPVTEENKQEYVRLVVEYRLTGSIKEQLEEFLKGFHDIVTPELISIFDEQELELLISGLPDIDVDDWKTNTEYHNYSAASSQIQWFWRAVRSFDKEEKAKLLQFVTGTSKVPLNGFKELEGMNGFSRFNVHRDYGSKDRLPSSHTCFNRELVSTMMSARPC
ncbi:MAG: hypothetical protein M1836_003376 [Candelina mexicana]|nr:MAG: hypothetical protein M1836_003376 [Candelina mexicana]